MYLVLETKYIYHKDLWEPIASTKTDFAATVSRLSGNTLHSMRITWKNWKYLAICNVIWLTWFIVGFLDGYRNTSLVDIILPLSAVLKDDSICDGSKRYKLLIFGSDVFPYSVCIFDKCFAFFYIPNPCVNVLCEDKMREKTLYSTK